ncbi:MAG: LysR family transcriptional regulator [Myxococcota bacterium]
MDFEQLRIFLILAEEGTFLGAANRLGTSRSRIRRKLEQLELMAETDLLLREGASLRLTPAGQVLERRGRHLLEEADLLLAQVHEVGETPRGRLRCALPPGPPPESWDQIRAEMQSAFPDVGIELLFSSDPCGLLPGAAEVAWSFDELIPVGCHGFEVARYPMALLSGKDLSGPKPPPKSVNALSEYRLGVWRPALTLPECRDLRAGGEIQLEGHFLSDDVASLMSLAAAGECLAFVPMLPECLRPGLVPVLADEIVGSVRLFLVVPDVLADIPRVREFVRRAHAALAAIH